MKSTSSLRRLTLAALLACFTIGASAQAVIFPQLQQPGTATCIVNDNTYTLQNDLLAASFVKQDGKLVFGGCSALNLKPGTDLFNVQLGNGTTLSSSDMTLGEITEVSLPANANAVRGIERFDGKALEAQFTSGNLSITWRAVLRDGSHYLRTEMAISSTANQAMQNIVAMNYMVDTTTDNAPSPVGNTRGAILVNNKIFAGLETPMGLNSVETNSPADPDFKLTGWTEDAFDWTPAVIPSQLLSLKVGENKNLSLSADNICATAGYAKFTQAGNNTVTFSYTGGSHRLNIIGVDITDLQGNIISHDYHYGFTGNAKENNTYTINVPQAGIYILRYFMETRTETITSTGNITFNNTVSTPTAAELPQEQTPEQVLMTGKWVRQTTLETGKTWNVSAVIGLIAPGQARRSVLCYVERERAVPWRPMNIYNSWYELNIDRNNASAPAYEGNMTIAQCVDVAKQWKTNLYEKYQANIGAFVWDDGWDSYGTWTFNPNFPNGFKEADEVAKSMNTGIGAWLGPVGGYGSSGDWRRAYWNNKGGMTLANPAYYKVFLDACTNLVTNYDFRFFKFDGISAQFSSVGPDDGPAGWEKAEGIIQLESDVRQIKPDIFLNTSVGTWASPFWFRYTDAVWRQENDWGAVEAKGDMSSSNDRERWITYRDRLVYQNFVKNSPLCPINNLMTHGFILTKYGNVSKNMTYKSIRNEMRCAFACGSGMVELYADYPLLNATYNTQSGILWKDLADCIKWQKKNKDVLPDIHWVGGNPYNNGVGDVYGWAAWNGTHCVLTLRNPNATAKAFKFTLREVFEIPDYITDSNIVLTKAFADQVNLPGVSTNTEISLDKTLSVTLPAHGVFIFDGTHTGIDGINDNTTANPNPDKADITYDLQGRKVQNPKNGIFIKGNKKIAL